MTTTSILNEIATKLSANYFNVSLRNSTNSRAKELHPDVLSRVFEENCGIDTKNDKGDLVFSRNILIIGAGAAKGELPFFYTGPTAIDKIEEILEFKMISDNPKLSKKYRSLASHYYKTVYGSKTDIKHIQSKLGFEGRLSLLLNFFDKQDVLDVIKKLLDFKYLYCHFYDIIAHFFKHRFIDVIVNFNFDELLDNAIDEEMGPTGMYHKIVHDSECYPINELMENERLKVPIYIKPHGTISSKTSLLFTKEHYIDMSEDMLRLLHGVFMGKVGKEGFGHSNINIIVAGFAMASIELNNILFSLHKQEYNKNIKFYIFTLTPDIEISDFKKSFRKWEKDNQEKTHKTPECIPIPSGNDSLKNIFFPSLSDHFSSLFIHIKNKFKKPFTPIGLNIHTVLSKLFPKEKINEIGIELLKGNTNNYLLYLERRFIFHLLYELIKWKGKIAINVIIKERAGKYFNEYKHILNKLEKENSLQGYEAINTLEQLPDIISFMKERLGIDMENDKSSPDNIYECTSIFKNSHDIEIDVIKILNVMIEHSLAIGNITDQDKSNIASYLRFNVFDSKIYNVSPLYEDVRHSRFRYFSNEHIISTNLSLTYKFFEYAVLKEEFSKKMIWNKLLFASESGTPIFNLHRYCDTNRGDSYLKKFIIDKKKVFLLFSDDKMIKVNNITLQDPLENDPTCFEYINTLLYRIIPDNFECKHLSASKNIHHMALFCNNDDPKFGFYFFRPEAKNRINPVWFELHSTTNDYNDYKNLIFMKNLFDMQYSLSKPIESQI